jgi:hypothetical protein
VRASINAEAALALPISAAVAVPGFRVVENFSERPSYQSTD